MEVIMNKRILVLVLSLMMLVGIVLGATSCDIVESLLPNNDGACEHQWSDATCTEPKTCKLCKATDGEALGHTGGEATCESKAVCTRCEEQYGDIADHEWQPATCDKLAECKLCGETSGELLNHTPAEDDGDCTTAINCTVCGKEVTPANNHTPAEDDGDCTTAVNCTVCGKEVIPAKNHTPEADDGDCTTEVKCTACGTVTLAARADHTPEADDGDCTTEVGCSICTKVAIEAAENHTGKDDGDCTTAVNCTVCGTQMVAANDAHTPEADDGDCETPTKCSNCDVITAPAVSHVGGTATCAQKAVCDVCGKTYGTTLEHSFTAQNTDAKYVATPATCDDAATYYYSCANCGDRSNETFVHGDPLGHNYGTPVSLGDGTHVTTCLNDPSHTVIGNCSGGEATCTDRAVCSECNEEYGDEPLHAWNDGEITKNPGCTEAGVMTYSCSACGEKMEKSIDAVGHTYVDTVTDPTCLESGFTTHTCSVCGYTYTDTETDALGHEWNTDLTCTEGHSCVRGDCSVSEDALGHSYESVKTTTADCVNAATEVFTCHVCGDSYTNVTAPATGHNIVGVTAVEEHVGGCDYLQVYACATCGARVEGQTVVHHTYTASIVTPSTCKDEGVKAITCSVCGDTYNEAIPVDTVIGHSWSTGTVENGKRTDSCSICGETKTVTVVTNDTVTSVGDLKDTEISLESGANITLGGGAADHIGADTKVTVSADTLTDTDKANLGLTDEELSQVKGEIYNFNITSGDTNFTEFGADGYVTVTIPYELDEGEDVDNIAVWYIDNEGKLTSIKATYNNGFVTFTTNHFSYYTVTRLTPSQRCDLYGHIWADKDVEATCTTDGYTLHRCTRCGKVEKLNEVEAYGHALIEDVIEATCTTDGYVIVDCERCAYHDVQKISASGHIYTIIDSKAATCSSVGYELHDCDNCDHQIRVTLAQLKHEYTDTFVAPSCGTNGYTLHDCNNCDYSYTDNVVPALEHDFDAKWEWSDDHKHANVTLDCKHGCGHSVHGEAESNKKDHDATCSKEAKYEYTVKFTHNGKVYVEKYTENGEKLPHKFSDGWKFNKHGHWHDCKACGEKKELLDHEFDEGTIIKRPGCNTKGEIAYVCMCGYVLVESVEPTGDHYFVGGICVDCGFSKNCDHTTLTTVSLDLGALGHCKGVLEYQTCECGQVKMFDMEDIDIGCNPSKDPEMGEGVDENGNAYQYMSGICPDCGLYVYAYATLIQEDCRQAITATYYFYTEKGGDLIIDLTYSEEYYRHSIDVLPLGLKDISCGTEIYLEKCVNCGTVSNIDEIMPGCKFETTTDQFYDEIGNPHQKQVMTCPDCGLVISVEMYVIYDSVCEMTMYGILEVYVEGELFFEFTLAETDTDHNYEETYELHGETCEDGYTVNRVCTACGDKETWNSNGHRSDYEEFRLAEYGMCNGYGYRHVCKICNTVTSARVEWSDCSWNHQYYDEELGVDVYQCPYCGAVKHYQSTNTSTGSCSYVQTVIEKYFIGELVIDSTREMFFDNHSMKYDYVLNGESCEDGWTLHAYCEKCDYEYNNDGNGHSERQIMNVRLSELGMCGEEAYFQVYSCACGERGWVSTYFHDGCEWVHSGEKYYVDDNGLEHTVYSLTCQTCGSVVHQDSYHVYEGCYIYYYTTYTITVNGEVVVDGVHARSSTGENHKLVYDYTLNGESCEDGWTLYAYCVNCDYSFQNEGSHHEARNIVFADLSAAGMCGESAYFEMYSCACGREAWVNTHFYDGCNWDLESSESYVDDEGITHNVETRHCADCNSTRITDSYTVADGCYRVNYCTYTVIIDGVTVVDNVHARNSRWESHDYEYQYYLVGDSCEDGVRIERTCTVCGMQYTETYTHHYNIGKHYNLSEYGACGGYVEFNKCPCGYESYVYFSSCGNGHYTNNQYIDDDGILKHVESYYCEICELRYTKTYYYTTENCMRTTHFNMAVSVGAELVIDESYTSKEEYHNYVTSGELVEGAENCGDGVNVTFTCLDCGYSYTDLYHHHYEYTRERIDLSKYGCVCTGYFEIQVCACGESVALDTEDALCDFGYYGTNIWMEEALNCWQETAEGDRLFDSSADSLICAVTDPEQCGFTIRCGYYWLKTGNCTATRYTTIQIGYDELTDTWLDEFTYVRDVRTFHNYGDTVSTYEDNVVTHTTTCLDCGSYHAWGYETNEAGYTVKDGHVFVNTLDDGERKYREYFTEYLGYDHETFGNYDIRHYQKYINADGSEWWSNTDRTLEIYDAPFGTDGVIYKRTNTNSIGLNEYVENANTDVYVECCGNNYCSSFDVYEYRLDNNTGEWYRMDYVYGDSLCEYKIVYTHSNGDSYEEEGYGHRQTHYQYTKNPTCTQYGEYSDHCVYCKYTWNSEIVEPNDHGWVLLNNGLYYCYECGLQNINGASGDVVMEDLTEKYGNGENYVVGYWSRTYVQFSVYVSLMLHTPLEDGTDQINLIEDFDYDLYFVEDPYVGLYVSKAQVEAAALALGYTADMYDVRISFVPDGADGSFDYAITFADLEGSEDIDYTIKRDEYFLKHVFGSDVVTYTICPEQSGEWFIEVQGFDYWHYIADIYVFNNSTGEETCANGSYWVYLEAGVTYTVSFRWNSYYDDRGYVAFVFDFNEDSAVDVPVVEENPAYNDSNSGDAYFAG